VGKLHRPGLRLSLHPPELTTALEQSSTERPGQVMAAFRPVQTFACQSMPPWSELADIDAENGIQPRDPSFCDINALALFGWSNEPAICQGIGDLYTELAGKVIVAGSRIAQRLSLW